MNRRRIACALLALSLPACIGSNDDTNPKPSATPSSLRSLLTPGAPRWRTLAAAPEARQEVAAALVGSSIYVAGGLTDAGASNRVDVYDIDADSWTRGPDLPVALHHAAGVGFRGAAWVIGGFDASSRPLRSVYVLRGDRWVETAPLAEPRAAPAAVVAGDRIVVAGGQGAGELVGPTEVFEPSGAGTGAVPAGRWVRKAPIPTRRHHLAAAVTGTQIYFSGGRAPGASPPDRNLAAFERYDVATNTWTKLPNVPTARSGHGSGVLDGRVVVVGGEDPARGGGPSIELTEAFDPKGGQWKRDLPAMFRARHGVGAVTEGNRLFVMLGGSRVALAPSADADALVVP